jgi:hypothetical protein
MLHEEPHLVIGHVAAGHERSSKAEKAPTYPTGRDHPAEPNLRSGYALPAVRVRRVILIQIAARFSS